MEMITSLHIYLFVSSHDMFFRMYIFRSPIVHVDFRQDSMLMMPLYALFLLEHLCQHLFLFTSISMLLITVFILSQGYPLALRGWLAYLVRHVEDYPLSEPTSSCLEASILRLGLSALET